jgi:hypothetical protein
MGAQRPWVILGLLLAPAGVFASDHQFDVFLAPSYLEVTGSSFKLLGWHVSGAAVVGEGHWLSVVGDLSFHFDGLDDETSAERTEAAATLGLRFTVPHEHALGNLFGQFALLGAVHRSVPEDDRSTAAAAVAIGAGYDLTPERMGPWGLRVQADYIQPISSDLGHGWRGSVGVIYRFH